MGVGASAGGFEAFVQLLRALPPDTGMAFVLIQHLDPTHPSSLAESLARATTMPVTQARDGEAIEANHVYVIPSGDDLAVLHGTLTLLPRRGDAKRLHLPIDFFFRSLAADRGRRAIGVILSGTASDGTEGLRAIKQEEGITLVQDPDTAKFGGMPRSAVAAGVVDKALPVDDLARELVHLSRHPYLIPQEGPRARNDRATLHKIFALLRNTVGVDFSEYKTPTVERRLARRMALRRVQDLPAYLELLLKEPAEVRALYDDTLIHVTSFFRDPDAFAALGEAVFPAILDAKTDGAPIRVWSAGCSTGEEAYSLAIVLLEHLERLGDGRRHPVQIFGSDISEKAIERARAALYPDAVMADVSEERRSRFFTRTDAGYRIDKSVRDLCVFVRHDLARDPPFSRIDLISCRNVLIYFDQALQARALATFQYALNRPGFLLLGRSESIAAFGELFAPIDKAHKIFARTAASSTLRFAPRLELHPVTAARGTPPAASPAKRGPDLSRHFDHLLLTRYAPPAILINERMEILQFRGDTGPYLSPASGEPQSNLVKMARRGLMAPLRTALAQAKEHNAPVTVEDVEIDVYGTTATCNVSVAPFVTAAGEPERLFVVLFERPAGRAATPPLAKEAQEAGAGAGAGPAGTPPLLRRIAALDLELTATKEYLESLIDDHRRANEDLNTANEELVSANEELQSMNEELETAKEELQSTNEELTTVNDELHSNNLEVNRLNADLMNLLGTVDIPILILDSERRVRRFTPQARDILNVVASDVGRPIDDIKANIAGPEIGTLVAGVIESNAPYEAEVRDMGGRWYRMQIRPYQTTDKRIDGATLSFVDIDALKHHVEDAQRARADAERADRAKDAFLATLSHELRTPLTSMLLQAQLLRERAGTDPAAIKRAAEAIERGTLVQANLIDDLLDVSRIVAGKLKMDMQVVDLARVVGDALDSVRALAERKTIRFDVAAGGGALTVAGDPTRLQQIVTNLLTNAIKFSKDGATVAVDVGAVGERAFIRVTDTGMGIDPAFLPHVFTRFSQEDATSTRAHGGLGIGLAIVRHLVEAHGGTVSVASGGVGKGASFEVLLPLMRTERGSERSEPSERSERAERPERARVTEPSAKAAAVEPVAGRLANRRILVVDDDEGTRNAVTEMLRYQGASVRSAASAADAMPLVESAWPELVFCDIAMPAEDGCSFLRRVRALDPARGGNVRAIALTALAGDDDKARALAAGFQAHLAKPVDMAHLVRTVEEVWARPGARPESSLPA